MWPEELLRSPKLLPFLRLGIIPLVLIVYITASLHFDYTPDDTYIYLRYAKNLADGNGFVFNQNEPSLGVTGPLWVLLIAAGTAGGLDPYVVAKILDLVFASLALLVFLRLAAVVLQDILLAFAATAVFCLDAWFLRWAGSGLETSLAVVLVLSTFYYTYRSEYVIASLTAGLLTLVRPECGLLFLIILADNLINTRQVRPALESALRSVGMFVATLTPWLVYSYLTFGTIMPNSLGAKSIRGYSLETSLYVAGSQSKIILITQGLSLALLIVGVVGMLRRHTIRRVWVEAFPVVWIILLPLFYLLFNVQVVSRYLLPVLPLIAIFGVWGVKKSADFWKFRWQTSVAILLGLVVLSGAQNQTFYYSTVVRHLRGFVAGMNDCMRPIAYKINEIAGPDDKILTPDIGLLGYISERKLYDTAGLVTPEVKRTFKGFEYGEGMKRRVYEQAVLPDFVVDRSVERERLKSETLVPVMTRVFPSLGLNIHWDTYYTLYKRVP